MQVLRRVPGMLDGGNKRGETPLSIAEALHERLVRQAEEARGGSGGEVAAVEAEDEVELSDRILEVLHGELDDSDDE